MRNLFYLLLGLLLGGFLAVGVSHADETTINYKGQPVPSAMAPSMSAFSQDVCGIGSGVAGALIGLAGLTGLVMFVGLVMLFVHVLDVSTQGDTTGWLYGVGQVVTCCCTAVPV